MQNDQIAPTRAAFHVVIIGGGIGGLCLAQGLKQAGISVAVYERDRSVSFRSQGYRIHINQDGNHALHACLPAHLFQLFFATSGLPFAGVASYDARQLQEDVSESRRQIVAEAGFLDSVEVNRLTLREILLAGLDDVVSFDKTLERFEQRGEGLVRAFFTDGTSAEGNLLIGADGTRSVTRQLLLPHARVSEVGLALYGRTLLTRETGAWMPQYLIEGFSRIADDEGLALVFGAYRKREAFAEATARYLPALQLTETPDYLTWTLSTSLERLGLTRGAAWPADPATLHAVVSRLVEAWHPALRRIIAEADIPATFALNFRLSQPVQPWQTTNVTLLGDAIHTMPPFRGVGANIALRDAELLHRALVAVAKQEMPLLQAIGEYEAAMLDYGFDAVKKTMEQPLFDRPGAGR